MKGPICLWKIYSSTVLTRSSATIRMIFGFCADLFGVCADIDPTIRVSSIAGIII